MKKGRRRWREDHRSWRDGGRSAAGSRRFHCSACSVHHYVKKEKQKAYFFFLLLPLLEVKVFAALDDEQWRRREGVEEVAADADDVLLRRSSFNDEIGCGGPLPRPLKMFAEAGGGGGRLLLPLPPSLTAAFRDLTINGVVKKYADKAR